MATDQDIQTDTARTPRREGNWRRSACEERRPSRASSESIERDLILTALRESHGNKAKAARALGITERLMGIRVKRLGIDWRGLRTSRKRVAEHTAGS